MGIVMGADAASNSQPAASRPRYMQAMHTILKMKYILPLAIATFMILSCKSKNSDLTDDLVVDGSYASQPDSLRDKSFLNSLVDKISRHPEIIGQHEGMAPTFGKHEMSEEEKELELLQKSASIDQLVKLTDHNDVLVKSLAFQALKNKNYPDLKKIFENHITDNQMYSFYSGCTVERRPLNIDFYHCIYPTLNKTEIDHYKSQLMSQYKNTMFEIYLRYP